MLRFTISLLKSSKDINYIYDRMSIVSVNLMGGLGNQLFQIAAAYAYARKTNKQLQLLHITTNGNRPVYWNSILQKMHSYLVSSLVNFPIHWNEDLPTMYKEIPEFSENVYLHGYLQSSKYFYNDALKDEIKDLFRPSAELMKEVSNKYQYVLDNKDRVVVVHARRTDYLENTRMINIHGPLTPDYYEIAIEKMKRVVERPIWVLSSDDNEFWKEVSIVQTLSDVVIVNECSDIHAFALLQQFEHYIISNSTFIWWCTWLSPAKKVIAPSRWFGPIGPRPFEDIYEPEWERI